MSDRVLGVHVMCNSLVEEWAESDQECVWGEGSVRGLLVSTDDATATTSLSQGGGSSPHSPLLSTSLGGNDRGVTSSSPINGNNHSIGMEHQQKSSPSTSFMSPAASLSLPWSPAAQRGSGVGGSGSPHTNTSVVDSNQRLPSLADVTSTIDQFNSRSSTGTIKGGMGVCIRKVVLPNPSNRHTRKESSEARLSRLGAALLMAHQGGVVNDDEESYYFTQGVRNLAKAAQLDIRAAVWRYWWNQLTAMMPSSSFQSLDGPHTVIVLLVLVPRDDSSHLPQHYHQHHHPNHRHTLLDWKMLLSWRSFLEAYNRLSTTSTIATSDPTTNNNNPTFAINVPAQEAEHINKNNNSTVRTRAAHARLLTCTTTTHGGSSSSPSQSSTPSSHHHHNGFYSQAILDLHVSCLVSTLEATCCGNQGDDSNSYVDGMGSPSQQNMTMSQSASTTSHRRHRQYKGAWDVLFLLEEHQKLLEDTLLNILGTLILRPPQSTIISSSLEDSNDGQRPMVAVVRRRLGMIAEQISQCVLDVGAGGVGNTSSTNKKRGTTNNKDGGAVSPPSDIVSLFEYNEEEYPTNNTYHHHDRDHPITPQRQVDKELLQPTTTTTTKNAIGMDITTHSNMIDGSHYIKSSTSSSPSDNCSLSSLRSSSNSNSSDDEGSTVYDGADDDGGGEGAMHVVDKVITDYSIFDDGKQQKDTTSTTVTFPLPPPPVPNSGYNDESLSALLHASTTEDDTNAARPTTSAPPPPSRNIKYLSETDGYEVVDKSGVFFDEKAGLIDKQYMQVSAVFIKNAIPLAACHAASTGLEKAATKHNMRILTNGGLEPPDSGIVGYYDYSTTPSELKCRETAFTRKNFGVIAETCTDFVKSLDTVYKQNAPLHHQLQKSAAPPEYQLFDTAFSTLTVNKNFRTAAHTDQGDFKSGFGVVSVLSGEYGGCHLAIPKLNKAFNIRPGDVLLFDTSLEHGNTEVHCPNYSWERVSVVAYLRTKLLSSMCEQERHIRRLRRLQKPLKAFKSAADATDVVDLRKLFFNNKYNHHSSGHQTPATTRGSPVYLPRRLLQHLTPTQVSALLFAGARLSSRTIRRGGSTTTESGGGCVIGLPMGHGKTLLALTLAFSHLHEFPLDDVLIVTPKSVIPHWRAEAVKWSSKGGLFFRSFISRDEHDTQWDVALMYYNQQTVSEEIPKVGHIFVINAESLASLHRRCPKLTPSMILVDEGHKVGTGGSDSQLVQILMRMTKGGGSSSGGHGSPVLHKGGSTLSNSNHIAGYGSNARRVVFTGTPLQNNAMEIYTLVEFVCPVIFRLYPKIIFNQKVEIIERYIKSITLQDLAKATSSSTSICEGGALVPEYDDHGDAILPQQQDEGSHHTSPQHQQQHPTSSMAEGSSQICSIDVDAEEEEEIPTPPPPSSPKRLSSCLKAAALRLKQAPQPLSLQQRRRDLEEAVDAQTFVVNWMQGFVFRDLSAGYVDHAKPSTTTNGGAVSTKKVTVSKRELGVGVGEGASSSAFGGHLGEGAPVVDPVASAAALPLYDFIIICGSSQAQLELLERYDLAGNIATAQSVLRAVEHRPFHIGAHPLTFYNFLLHRDRNSKAAILSSARTASSSKRKHQVEENNNNNYGSDSSIDSDVEFMMDDGKPSLVAHSTKTTTTTTASSSSHQSIGSKRGRPSANSSSSLSSSKTLELPREEIKFLETCVASSLHIRGRGTTMTSSSSQHQQTLPLDFLSLSGKLTTCVAIVLRAMRLQGGKTAGDQQHSSSSQRQQHNTTGSCSDKILIFSQYVQIQLLLVATFEALGVGCVHISGQDSTATRKEAVERFRGNYYNSDMKVSGSGLRSPSVMIASTKAAAFGLDLTVANHVIMFDSWWNPQLDAQAIARVRRTNQTKPVFVYRLASEYEDAIILSAHRKKIALFECVINGRSIDDIFGPVLATTTPPPTSTSNPSTTTTTTTSSEVKNEGRVDVDAEGDGEDGIDSSTDRDTYEFLLTLKKHQKLSTTSISKTKKKKIPATTATTTTTAWSPADEEDDDVIVARPAVVAVQTYASLMKGLMS